MMFCYHMNINIKNTIYRILVYTEGPFVKTIVSVLVRKEVELGNGIVEIYEESIYKNILGPKYYYLISHKIILEIVSVR